MNTIHLAFGLHDEHGTYCRYIATVLATLFKNTKFKITVHILCDETLKNADQLKLIKFCQQWGNEILFYKIDLDDKIKQLPSLADITVGTLFRLYVPYICKVEKIIYLDADILVLMDINELWRHDLTGYFAAGVKDTTENINRNIKNAYYKKIGIDYQTYFNAGVLLLNCELIRHQLSVVSDGLEMLNRYKYLLFADQDVLNKFFNKKIKILDNKFNLQIDLSNCNDLNIFKSRAILHFSGYFKPWNCSNPFIIKHYMEFMHETPFLADYESFYDFTADIIKNYDEKMDFKHCLYYKSKSSETYLSILCIFKAILAPKLFFRIKEKIWDLRQSFKYDFLYLLFK